MELLIMCERPAPRIGDLDHRRDAVLRLRASGCKVAPRTPITPTSADLLVSSGVSAGALVTCTPGNPGFFIIPSTTCMHCRVLETI